MIGNPPFPRRPGDLTKEFLGETLGQDIVSFEVQSIGADRGMLGDIVLVTSTTDRGLRLTPVVLKFPTERVESRASSKRGGVHLRELNFYDQIAPRTPVRTPDVIASWYDAETDDFLIVQNAVDVDVSVDQIDGLGPERVHLVIEQMARCHATWWQSSELLSLPWLPRLDSESRRHNLGTLATRGWEPLCDLLGETVMRSHSRLGSDFPSVLDQRLVELAGRKTTLVHSDLRADNLLFVDGSEEVFIIDWQGAGIAPAAWDIAYLISQSMTIEDRRKHEETLISLYLAELSRSGPNIERSEFLYEYGQSLIYGLAVATSLPLIGDTAQPRVRRLAETMTLRALDAMEQHGVLW